MEYPATQMFVDDEEDADEEAKEDENDRTPLRPEKKVKFATLVVDSITHSVYRGKGFVNKVGRIDSCNIVIDHNTISKEHAEIEAEAKSTFISDLGSLNKTKLNDVILRPGRLYQLRDGDNIRFGSVQAVFKLDENSGENFAGSRLSDDFVIPDTPAIVPKMSRQIIPGTPDLSFDRSSIGTNCSSDVSMVAGTQEAGNPNGRSSPRFTCRGSSRGLTPASEKANTSKASLHDTSDLQTRNNISLEDSDEENIFDMLTQQSDIHEEETQRFSAGKIHTVKPARFSADRIDDNERHSPSIDDMETQNFYNEEKIDQENRACSINDLETQKLPVASILSNECSINDLETQKITVNQTETNSCSINDLGTQKIPTVGKQTRFSSIHDLETQKFPAVGIQTRFSSINDLETQKFPTDNVKASVHSINDLETQKLGGANKDGEDSETDEEGMFEDSTGSDGVDMFDAPTQLMRPPRSPKKTDDVAVVTVEEEMAQQNVPKPQDIEEGNVEKQIEALAEVKTCTKLLSMETNEEKKSTLNDSIESKLNNMFDDVNESGVEEPTQMLTQHLESILNSTQVGESGSNKAGAEKGDTEEIQAPPASDDDVVNSDREELSKTASDVPIPEIASTQELFGDLPTIHFASGPAESDRERTETPSPLNVIDEPARPKKAHRSEPGSPGATNKTIDVVKSVDIIDKNRSTSSNGVESKRTKSTKKGEPMSETVGIKNNPPQRKTGRGKSKAQKDVSPPTAGRFEESKSTVEDDPVRKENGKELPPKKRGRSTLLNPSTPEKIVAVVTPTTRAGSRSSVNVPVEVSNKPSRFSTADRPKVTDDEKPKSPVPVSPVVMEPPSKRSKRDTKSKKNDTSTSSSNNSTLQTETDEPRPISAPRTPSRRIQNKRLQKSAVVSDEETTPVKKAKTSKTALPPTVNDRRDKRRNTNLRGRDVPDTSDRGSDRNDSPSTRTRRTRPQTTTSALDDEKSLSGLEKFDSKTQSSLESQEIQAILGIVDEDDDESFETIKRMPSFRREMRIFRSQVTVNDSRKDEEYLRGSPKTDKSKETVEDRFEKPAEKPQPQKRLPRRSQAQKNDDNEKKVSPPKSEPAIVAIAKPRGRPTRGSKIEKEEKKVEDPPPPAIVEQKSTPKKRTAVSARGRREVAQKSGEKGNVVEELAPKRGRRKTVEAVKQNKSNADTERKVSPSSSSSSLSPLRRGRSSLATPTPSAASPPRTKQRILFTGLNDPHLISIVNSLGGTITEKPNDCTALVTDKIRRTYKFLCSMAMAVPIVSVEWLTESEGAGHFLNTDDFLLEDPVEEARFKFSLRRSLTKASGNKLLEGYTVVLTPNTSPPPTAELKGMIQACGGKALVRPPTKWPEKSLIISRREDANNAKKFLAKAPKSVHLQSLEFILTGILRHEINFEEHKLEF